MFHVSIVYATSNIVRRGETHFRRLYIQLMVSRSIRHSLLQCIVFVTHLSNIRMGPSP